MADNANPNSTATKTTCKISPSAKAFTTVVGMMCIRKSVTLCCLAAPAYAATALLSSDAAFTLKPAPVCTTLPTTNPTNRAIVDTTSKYSSALPPTRPTFFMSPIFAMPVTTVQKMTSVITMLIARMKASPSGFMDAAACGRT